MGKSNNPHAARILVVEDEEPIRKFLKSSLTTNGFHYEEASTAREGMTLANSHPPDLIILDLGLPDRDGLDVIRDLRGWSAVPILVLSARGQEEDKITALESGADDYITKPFGVGELLARIKVALRHAGPASPTTQAVFEHEGLRLDMEKRQLWLEGKEVQLTPVEYKLLTVMVKHAGKVLTHNQLLKEVWGKHTAEHATNLRIYVQHLRKKLGDAAVTPKFIKTEIGVGYRWMV